MGLFDFVKEAGQTIHEKAEAFGDKLEAMGETISKKVGIGGAKTAQAAQAGDSGDSEEFVGPRLAEAVKRLGIPVDDLEVVVDGDVAKVSATAATQADREKIILAVGNTKGIAKVDESIATAGSEPPATFYTVVKGDTLSKIAKAHYGDAMKYPAIFNANKPMLTDPNRIYPGQVLRLPDD